MNCDVDFLVWHEADPKIIHRDIKSANILIDDNFEAMVKPLNLDIVGALHSTFKFRIF